MSKPKVFNRDRFWFSVLLVIQLAFWLWLWVGRRMPAGHDTFQYFTLQYYFLNHVVEYGHIPQWMPFMTQGTVATWWYVIQASFLQNVLLLLGPLLKGINDFYLFYVNMLVDELVLAVGCWLWCRYYLTTPWGRFFFTITVFASSIWMTQVWFNFHYYYCLPLMFFLGHRFLETGKWRYFILLADLFVVQAHGNLPYFLPVQSAVIFLYFLLVCIFSPEHLSHLRFNRWAFGALLGSGLLLLGLWFEMTWATGDIVNYNFGRLTNEMVSLGAYLHYGGNLGLAKWKECVLGISPDVDRNLYMGLAALPLMAWALLMALNRRIMPVVFAVILLLNLSSGGITAFLLYKFWPMMTFYRHLGLTAVLAKLFLCLLAAYGFEAYWQQRQSHGPWQKLKFLWPALIPLICIFYLSSLNFQVLVETLKSMVVWGIPEVVIFAKIYSPSMVGRLMVMLAVGVALILIFVRYAYKPSWRAFLMFSLLAVQVMDVCLYQWHELNLRSFPGARQDLATANFQPMPFALRRESHNNWGNPRAGLILHMPLSQGVEYWSNDSFLFKDEPGSEVRADHWLRPLDRFMRAYWGQPIDNVSLKPKGLTYYRSLDFPLKNLAARKFSGVDADKIQIFKSVLPVPDEQQMARMMIDVHYQGNVPLVYDPLAPERSQENLSLNSRWLWPYTISNFNADELGISFSQPLPRPAWLMYADVWSKQWRAQADGRSIPVQRVNLAYKIVHLAQGTKKVDFSDFDFRLDFLHRFFNVNALIWVFAVLYLAGSIYAQSEQKDF